MWEMYPTNQMTELKGLAIKVRNAFEEIAKKEGWNNNLGGLCGRASIQLLLAAERHGIKGVDICVGCGHLYCMYEYYVIDITATQFGVADRVFWITLLDIPKSVIYPGHWNQVGRYRSLQELFEYTGVKWSGLDSTETDKVVVMKHTKEYSIELERVEL